MCVQRETLLQIMLIFNIQKLKVELWAQVIGS